MATAYNMVQVLPYSSHQPRYEAGDQFSVDFEYTLAGAVVTGDTYTTPANAIPTNGIRIIETCLIMPALDTNATPTATISVGDSGSATRFITGANAGSAVSGAQMHVYINQAQGLTSGVVSSGTGYLYGASASAPQIVVTVGGTVASAQTAGTIRLRVTYICSGEN